MTEAERHRRVMRVLREIYELPAEERDARLARLCGDDRELEKEVRSLLDFDSATTGLDLAPFSIAGAKTLDAAALPKRVGSYEVDGLLGEGGMGLVYRARQKSPSRVVALKVLRPDSLSPRTLRRFDDEVRILGRLRHPGIAQIHDAGLADAEGSPRPYFAMELVEGVDIATYARERSLDVRTRVALLVQIADALHHAHQQGVIHRDLKPSNIMVDASGAPKILDFGVARLVDHETHSTSLRTQAGQLVGTLPYMSPEQAAGNPDGIDVRSDVYNLGVVAFELMTGDLPYDVLGRALPEVVRVIHETPPKPLSSRDRKLAGDLETIVFKALRKDRQDRYASAFEMGADLQRHLDDRPVLARPPSRVYLLSKFVKRHRGLTAAVMVIALTLVIGAGAASWQAAQARRAADRAQREAASWEDVSTFLFGLFAHGHPEIDAGRSLSVKQLIDRGAARIDELEGQPLVRTRLMRAMAVGYHGLGELTRADQLLTRALAELREQLPDAAEEIARTLYCLGQLDLDRHRPAAAEARLEESIALFDGLGHPWGTVDARRCLGMVRIQQGRHVEALALLTEARRLGRASGEDQFRDAELSRSLARAYIGLGRYEDAKPCLDQAMVVFERDPETYRVPLYHCHGTFGTYYLTQRDLERTRHHWERALELSEVIWGPDHARFSQDLCNLANVLVSLHELPRACELLERAMAIQEELPEPHRDLVKICASLGTAYLKDGQDDDARRYLERALAFAEAGDDELMTASVLRGLGSAHVRAGRFGLGGPLLRRSLRIHLAKLGEEDIETAKSYRILAAFCFASGELDQAVDLCGRALPLYEKLRGPSERTTLAVRGLYAKVLDAAGRHDEAREIRDATPTPPVD